jgi:hypothetical protein
MDSRPIHFQIFHPFIFKPMHNDMLTLWNNYWL